MGGVTRNRRLALGFLLITLGLIAAACGSERREPGQVHVLEWDGIVNPVMERYIDRGIRTAERSDAAAVVIQLDTPGGLDSSMRDIIQRIESSEVPVIVYVSPAGSRAASAGTFITMAGHVAAMAPSTTIGAASPVNSDGSDIEGALGRKVTNDAVAYIRGIAEQRGRNADWAEDAVRDAVAVNQAEAVELNVVDFVATGMDDLLAQSDGREVQVQTPDGQVVTETVQVANAPITENSPNIFERILYLIADPNIAFMLLSLGGLAIVAEIFSTNGVTGIFGVIEIVLAFFALGSLPTNWEGVALIGFGLVLITAEVFVTGFGVLGIGGVIAIAFGGLILTGSSETGFQVSRWLVVAFAVTSGAIVVFLGGMIMKARRMPTYTGRPSFIGMKGSVRSRLDPQGAVLVEGERWDAMSEDGIPIEEGTPIIVTRSEGFMLYVKRDPAFVKLLPAAQSPEG